MKTFDREKRILPAYPRTLHLPWNPNASRDDVVATEKDAEAIFSSMLSVEEKVDGANCGMARVEGNAVIRNRDHILRKGYQKDTPAKKQFASVWTWFYDHEKCFKKLESLSGGNVSVFGEWMVAQHGIYYDRLPSWFMTYDVYDYERGQFIAPDIARNWLIEAGFSVVPLLHQGPINNVDQLRQWCQENSALTAQGKREGLYLKIHDGRHITNRFKMVREDFVRGALWSESALNRNKLI